MELFLPEQIALNDTSKALIVDIEETARRVFEYRPLPPDVVRRVEDSLLGERVYSSNAIEGNTLDLRETVAVLQTGRILENKKRDAIEARNLGEAVKRISTLRGEGPAVHAVDKLLEVHKLILRETPDEHWGGRFREQRVLIEGAKHLPPEHSLIPGLVERVMEQLRKSGEISAILKATWAHWALARVHPFKDGNGRISRLWQDLLLFQGDLTAAVIRPDERKDYLAALTAADDGDFNPLLQLTAQNVLRTFDKYLAVIAQDRELDEFAKEIAGEADARIAQKRQLQFQQWVRRFEQLRWEFEICAGRITGQGGLVRIQFRPHNTIDQTTWESLALSRSVHAWFFRLQFDAERKSAQYAFIFLKHDATDLDNKIERSENRVGLFVYEVWGAGTRKRLDNIPDCPITLREVFLVEGEFVVRRVNRSTQETVYERNVSPSEIAKDFIREVVHRRLV